jgi:hypothetical protein
LPFGVLKQELPGPKQALEALANEEARANQSTKLVKSVNAAIASLDEGSVSTRPTMVPLAASSDQRIANEFVPAAPSSHFDDSDLGRTLSRGRLLIKCIEGIDIRRKKSLDRNPRIDPYIRFRLGAAERHPWKTTETKRKQDSRPIFDNEIVFFNILDPVQYIFQEDLQLCIELWNKSTTKDELVGSVTMSIVRFLRQAFVSYTEKVPIYYPGATRSSMKVSGVCLDFAES